MKNIQQIMEDPAVASLIRESSPHIMTLLDALLSEYTVSNTEDLKRVGMASVVINDLKINVNRISGFGSADLPKKQERPKLKGRK